ncbi:glycosyltransferase [Pseudanabaena sp. UWO310]|uniref:glycosyltransferase n=1 Tax=Pseudanabaena sp. UWO310 TaxID=2480795 RepID=UPI001157BB2E|nr:glycosyltransferase [Pseudanabaena sp. UWO310]TYQ31534.1 glycosyltransferase [Pseudanabaena sp. UWO310]
MNDRVTWLIPILNGMPYLPETLASIEAQTYKDWEVLVWDNGSTDGTLEELDKWIPSRLPGKVFTGEPYGVGGSLKRLVEECNTEFCARIDADDVNFPDRLEKQIAFLKENPEVAFVGSQQQYIDDKNNFQEYDYLIPESHDDIVHIMLSSNCICHPSVLFRKSAVLEVGNYRDLKNVEDYDLWLRLASHFKLANLNQKLIYYRVHPLSTTQAAIRENRIFDLAHKCLVENAPTLYGCTTDEAQLLCSHSHPLAIQTLLKISKYLEKEQGGNFLTRLGSESFIKSSKRLVSSDDVVTRFVLVLLALHKIDSYYEMIGIIKTILKKGYKKINKYINSHSPKIM